MSFTYDALNRVTFRDAPGTGNDKSYVYDLLGRTESVSIAGHTNGFTYNAPGQAVTATSPLGTVSYQYDSGGRRTRVTWRGGF